MPWLYDINNKWKGDSGSLSLALWEENGEVKYEHHAKPRVGVCIRVGSIGGRTFHHQDWWQTSYIKEILEEKMVYNEHAQRDQLYIKFKTDSGSIYEWKE